MKKIVALLLISFYIPIFPMEPGYAILLIDEHNETVKQDLDTSNVTSQGFGPLTSNLITALWQQNAIVVCSANIWRNFIERKMIFNDFTQYDSSTLQKKYKNKYRYFDSDQKILNFMNRCKAALSGSAEQLHENDLYFLLSFMLCWLTKVDSSQWTLKQANNDVYVLIPKKYEQERIKIFSKQKKIESSLSSEQLALGLHTLAVLQNPFDPDKHPQESRAVGTLSKVLEKIFITQETIAKRYYSNEKVSHMQKEAAQELVGTLAVPWYFYLDGHGSYTAFGYSYIAGMPEETFKELLQFFNTKITTQLLFYTTCFSGGQHLREPYEQKVMYPPLAKGAPFREATSASLFNYSIIATSLIYAPTYGVSPGLVVPFSLATKPSFNQYFDIFFPRIANYFAGYPKVANNAQLRGLDEIVNLVHPFLRQKKGNLKVQIPVIRYPGSEWFSIVDDQARVAHLTKTFVQAHEVENKPIRIKNKEIVLLAVQRPFSRRTQGNQPKHSQILVPVIIEKNKQGMLPIVLSTAPYDSYHYFEKIETKAGLMEFLKSCMPLEEPKYARSFYIKKLICTNDLPPLYSQEIKVAANQTIELDNVIILDNAKNPRKPTENSPMSGMLFSVKVYSDQKTFQRKNFQLLWPTQKAMHKAFFSKSTIPPLGKLPDGPLPEYPYKVERQPFLKEVYDILKKHPKMTPEALEQLYAATRIKTKEEKKLGELDKQLKLLRDSLYNLEKALESMQKK